MQYVHCRGGDAWTLDEYSDGVVGPSMCTSKNAVRCRALWIIRTVIGFHFQSQLVCITNKRVGCQYTTYAIGSRREFVTGSLPTKIKGQRRYSDLNGSRMLSVYTVLLGVRARQLATLPASPVGYWVTTRDGTAQTTPARSWPLIRCTSCA